VVAVSFAGRAQVGQEIAHRERHADRILGELAARGRDHRGAGFYASARQRDVGRDHDVADSRPLGDQSSAASGPTPAAIRSTRGSAGARMKPAAAT